MDLLPCVYVVDDDPAVLDSLSLLIKTAGLAVTTFDSAQAFLSAYRPDQPGCLVLDINMPGMKGTDLQEELIHRQWLLPIIFLTGCGDIPTTVHAIQAGAVDFLTKPVDAKQLLARIQASIVQDVLRHERQGHGAERDLSKLTARELEIARLLSKGTSNKEVARILDISPRTVENHRARVMDKTGAANLIELAHLIENLPPERN
ncbi:response regulator transcription factor [Methylomonas paludis]|uniref:Response regulator transcription factor n=1 Tax=Methylomonas paludis TaxID=1173101 RepID=A0A975MQC6_9GAMM|nr:response regulator [Methylomonas paludis]QWF72042.1 response regulator transcription factor [Methylomonas paludis]